MTFDAQTELQNLIYKYKALILVKKRREKTNNEAPTTPTVKKRKRPTTRATETQATPLPERHTTRTPASTESIKI